jgi:uncharacterized protein (DUF58 family)
MLRSLLARLSPAALVAEVRRRARAWADARQGPDPDGVVLRQRRCYILPTRAGVAFGLMVFGMLLGAMNYNASLAFVLAFGLAALGLVAMHHTHRTLEGLQVRIGRIDPVFAGQVARFGLTMVNAAPQPRYGITLTFGERILARADVPAEDDAPLVLPVRAPRRGWLNADRFGLHTTFPFGLFRAWAWLRMDLRCLVYPKPAPPGLRPPPTPGSTGQARPDESGLEDFAGLRGYRPGDAPRHIAWQVFARRDELAVKQFSGSAALSRRLTWSSLPGLDVEARLSQLTRWVLDAHAAGEAFALELPGREIGYGQGAAHRDRCLEALALFEARP